MIELAFQECARPTLYKWRERRGKALEGQLAAPPHLNPFFSPLG